MLRSYLFADRYPVRSMAFFYPKITLLDANRNPLLVTEIQQLNYLLSTLSDEPMERHRLELSIPVASGSGARYLLVHTSSDLVGSVRNYWGQMAGPVMPIGSVFVPVGPMGSGDFAVAGSPVTPPDMLKLRIVVPTGH